MAARNFLRIAGYILLVGGMNVLEMLLKERREEKLINEKVEEAINQRMKES